MTMNEFVTMLGAIRDDKEVKIPYQLHCNGQLRKLIIALDGTSGASAYFEAVLRAEPPTISERELNGK